MSAAIRDLSHPMYAIYYRKPVEVEPRLATESLLWAGGLSSCQVSSNG